MVARANEGLGGLLQGNANQWRAYLSGLMRQQGIDPSRNIYAAQILQRAPEAQWLGQAMNVRDTGMEDYARQWVNARFGSGGNYGGVDLSRQGMSNWLTGALASNDPNNAQYKMFNSGDPEADYANLGSAMGVIQGGYSPMARAAEQRTLGNWYERALSQMQAAGPGTPTNLLNYFYGRQDAGPGTPQGAQPLGAVPPGSAGAAAGTTNYANPGAQTAAEAAALAARNAAQAGQAQQPAGIGNTVLGGQAAATNWADLLNRYRGDQRNWGTEGYRPTPAAFNIGGISYDPTQDQVTGYNNMSGSGRVTNRGNFMGQFLYYLDLLRRQRDGAGNAALGITRATSDNQLAAIAAQRLKQNAVGSTGVTIAGL